VSDSVDPGAVRQPGSIPNPLRFLGVARILAGGCFVATGAATLRQYRDLVAQAQRLFGGDSGTTGAPLRSLLTLITAALLILVGLVLVAKGLAWLRRIPVPPEGPGRIEPDDVIATLRDRQLRAYGDGPTAPYWPLKRWLADEIAEMTWWRREVASAAVRAFVRACAFVAILSVCCLAIPALMTDDLVGPFPTSFAWLLPIVTGIWAVLGLMLLGSVGPRIESIELPLPTTSALAREPKEPRIVESPPLRMSGESPTLALTLGIAGLAVQCLMLTWWNLSPIDFPLRATSVVRHAGSIAGGLIFFAVGARMLKAATELLRGVRYESMLLMVDREGDGPIVRAAAVRTESLGIGGPRHLVAAVGGAYVRDSAEQMIRGVPPSV